MPLPTRFAGWPPILARLALLALTLLLLASAVVPTARPANIEGGVDLYARGAAQKAPSQGNQDIALYRVATARIAGGENYYDFIVAEQRRFDYPLRPGYAVRLPTLAYISAWLGEGGLIAAALALMLAVIAAWWVKLGDQPETRRWRALATAAVAVGMSLATNRAFFPLHELWAGGLLALSFGLHRKGHWVAAFLAAALALAIRELALPFVLLMGAFALWHRNWREAAAWSGLVALFALGMAVHLHLIARDVLPTDMPSAPWLVLRGLSGWLANVVQSSNLRWLPHFIAGPLVVLACFGWLGWNGREGMFGFLLSAGYGAAFMIASRWDNYYWGAMIAPAMLAGIVFAPRALSGLVLAVDPDRKLIARGGAVMQKRPE